MQEAEHDNRVAARPQTRRTFLKGSAALAGLAALGASATGCGESSSSIPDVDSSGDEIYQGLCRGNCGGGCRIQVRVREGKVISTGPTPEEDNPLDFLVCPRGLSHITGIYAPERIEYPVRRKEGTERGAGEWERLSWDEAIAYICDKWKGYRQEFGNGSICYSYGAGTYAQNYYMYMRLFTSLGATQITQENDMTMLNYSWKIFGLSLFMVGNNKADEANTHTFFIWGTNATIGTFNRWKYLMAARDNGARLVVIDPTYTCAAQKADLWVPIKPSTDAALAMCMMKYWHDNGRDDRTYLRDLTVAPFLVRQDTWTYLRADEAGFDVEREAGASTGGGFGTTATVSEGQYPVVVMDADGVAKPLSQAADPQIEGTFTVNGIEVKTAYTMLMERCDEWTVEATARKCEISEDTIVQLAELYLDGPTMLHTGFGIDHRGSGDGASHALCLLPLVSGQAGKRGAGISGNLAGATTGFAGDNWATVATSHYTPGLKTDISYLPEIMDTGMWNGAPLSIKSVYFYCCNPLGSYSGGTILREALSKVELIITADSVWNDTTTWSDVVLPVPHWFEYETYRTTPNPYIDFNDAAIPPQFESKPDTEIISLLGKGMDLDEYGEFSFTNDQIHQMFLDTETSAAYGISWETLKKVKHMKMAPDDFNYGSYEIPWGTASGRAEFFFENPTPEFDQTKPLDKHQYALPFQRDDNESYDGNPLKEKYPINLMTHRDKFKVHTAFAKAPWLLEIQPEPTIELNPHDAETYGVQENDYVKCFNDRGYVVLKAHLDPSMRPGVAWTEHTWLKDQYKAGHYSDVTRLGSNDFFPTNTPFDCLVGIEVWNGEEE